MGFCEGNRNDNEALVRYSAKKERKTSMNQLAYTVGEIAAFLGGVVEGDASLRLDNVSSLERGKESDLGFLSNYTYEPQLYTTLCGAVLVDKDFVPMAPVRATLIRVDNAYTALTKLLVLREGSRHPEAGISELAFVHSDAYVDKSCTVAPFAYVGAGAVLEAGVVLYPYAYVGKSVRVGRGTILYPHVVLCDDTEVGCECIIHPGAVLGADGFGFAPSESGYAKIPQTGKVRVMDAVEIGANSCVDRAVLDATTIHQGVKIDNLVQIAHNTEIGEHTVIAAQSGIAGSVKVGKWNRFAGQVGVAGHLSLADRVTLAAQTGVISDIKKEGETYFGSPAQPHSRAMRSYAKLVKLPEIDRELFDVRKELDELKQLVVSLQKKSGAEDNKTDE